MLWRYTALSPCQLIDGEIMVELQPGDEFEMPDAWRPEPDPHPSFSPAPPVVKPAPASAPVKE